MCGVSTLAPAHAVLQLVSCPGFFRDGMGCDPKLDMDRAWEACRKQTMGSPWLLGSGFTLIYELCFQRPEPFRFLHFI